MDRQNDNPPSPNPEGMRLTGTEQHEHDTLAELFLGDAPFAPTPMSSPSGAQPGSQAGAQSGPAPVDATVQSGPEPSAPRHGGAPTPTEVPVVSRFDGSAVRSMTPEDTDSGESGRPIVEMVVLGHLPVRASLWVRQYACQSARKRSETVALLRTAGDSVAIDVITGGERAEIEPVEDIDDAMTIAKAAANRVVVRVDETAEPELLEREGVHEVTILTGADEAAVVASYRLIKSLVATLDNRLDDMLDGSGLPMLRVAVMGGAGDDIQAACLKIERACKAFLDRPIEILDASGRIDATGTTSVCRVERAGAASHAIDALLGSDGLVADGLGPDSVLTPAAGSPLPDVGTTLRLASDAVGPSDMPEIVVLPGAGRDRAASSQIEAKPIDADPILIEQPRVEQPRLDAAGTGDVATAMGPVATLGLRLPELIEGLTPLETRCPHATGVWFATDDRGGLHAVASGETKHCVADLVTARAWATDNLALLLRAEPGIAMPSSDPETDAGAVLHLLSREPARWRGVLDSEVLVYAVAGITVSGEEHLVATPLNA